MGTVIILRGLPGSGKTTFAKSIGTARNICSADQFFEGPNGEYNWNAASVPSAHAACFKKFEHLLAMDEELIIVDNTNSRLWEFDKYIKAAQEEQYKVVVITVSHYFQTMAKYTMLEKRNVHGVKKDVIIKMAERWEDYVGEFFIVT